MTITIPNLSGAFEYPPRTVIWLIKANWNPLNTENVAPVFLIPTDTDTQDPWYEGQPPVILARTNGRRSDKSIAVGDTVFRCEYDVDLHIFAINQRQEWLFITEIRRIMKEFRRNPILKYSETNNPDSGLKVIEPPAPMFRTAPDLESPADVSETHSMCTVTAVWYEIRS